MMKNPFAKISFGSLLSKSDAERCENCMYSVNTNFKKEFGNWLCRRYPPTNWHMAGDIGEDLDGAQVILAHATHVPVNHNGWCGEFKVRKNA